LVQARISDDSMNIVAIPYGVVEALENERDDTFTSCISVTTTVKDVAPSIRVCHAVGS
jgi:hypothetical protein